MKEQAIAEKVSWLNKNVTKQDFHRVIVSFYYFTFQSEDFVSTYRIRVFVHGDKGLPDGF